MKKLGAKDPLLLGEKVLNNKKFYQKFLENFLSQNYKFLGPFGQFAWT